MKWNEAIKDYFTFTRKERIGVIIVLVLVIVVFFLPFFFNEKNAGAINTNDTAWINAIKALETAGNPKERDLYENEASAYQFDTSKANIPRNPTTELFPFDPNTLSATGWRHLGLRDKTIQTILNFRNKGGRFEKADDMQRIYGLTKKEYERIAHYVNIRATSAEKNPGSFANKNVSPANKPAFVASSVDINTVDTSELIALPGIGSKLAARIVNFRNKLGGFYSIEQIGETFGLPDTTFQKIKPYLKIADATVKKIDINIASADELKIHPYIKWQIANAIVTYRQEHGIFSKIDDIKKIMLITDDDYKKISPYLTLH